MFNTQLRRALLASFAFLFAASVLASLVFSFAEENEVGAKIYEKKCLMCHGKDGVGDTKAGKMMKTPDISSADWKNGKSVAEVTKTLHEGLGKMPKYEGKLSEAEIKAVAEYVVAKFAE
jgi:mono/diheme cytochrome c family protein